MSIVMGCFWTKYIIFELKKENAWAIFHETGEWCKIWRKTGLFFWKWHEEFGKYSPQHWKVSKLEVPWDHFIQSRKYMSLKCTGEGAMCHNNEKWCNIWRGAELSVQN